MDPVTMAGISIGASLVGGAVGAVGAEKKGEAQAGVLRGQARTQLLQSRAKAEEYMAGAEVSEYQAQVARNNAIIAEQNARYEREVGEAAAGEKLLETGTKVGAQRVGFAAGGVDVNKGSAVDVQSSTRQLGALDAATILNNAARKAYGYDVEKTGFGSEAILRTMSAGFSRRAAGRALQLGGQAAEVSEEAAGAAKEAGHLGAMASLLGGASSVSDKWLSFKQKGIIA